MGAFQRILKNLGAMFTGRAISILQQVVLPPVFVYRYSTALYGEWGVLSGAIGALSVLNFGVQTYMNQDLAVRFNRGETEGYHIRQSTALRLLLGIIGSGLLLCLVIFVLPLEQLLRLDISRSAAQWTTYLLAVQVLVNILFGYLSGIFMGVARAHRGSHWNNALALITSLGLLVGAWLRAPFPVLAAVQVLALFLCIAGVLVDLRRSAPEIFPSLRYWDGSAVRQMLKPSGYFGLITMCTFLTYQAPLIVLQRIVGPVAVAAFLVMRTVFSMCRQLLSIFTQSMGAEITNLFGRRDWPSLSKLYEYSERLIFFMIPLVNIGVLMLSPVLITVWMHKRAELFSIYPYVLSAAISMVLSLKEHKFQFQFSTNTHVELARIMFFSYLAMVIASVATVHFFGVMGFLWTWLAVELFQTTNIIGLNVRLFAHIEKIEFRYLLRLGLVCVSTLFAASFLLLRTSKFSLPGQLLTSVLSGLVVAAIVWPLFGVTAVLKMMSAKFLGRSAV